MALDAVGDREAPGLAAAVTELDRRHRVALTDEIGQTLEMRHEVVMPQAHVPDGAAAAPFDLRRLHENQSGPAGGESPDGNDLVRVDYEGSLIDGSVFDSSYERGAPAVFTLGTLNEIGSIVLLVTRNVRANSTAFTSHTFLGRKANP